MNPPAPTPSSTDPTATLDEWARPGSPRFIGGALAVLTLLVFFPARSFEFVNYDDPLFVSENAMVQQGLTLDGVFYAFGTTHASYWHPLTWLSHMLASEFFGINPAAHHVFNLLIHAANAALLFCVLMRLTGAKWRSALVAALFSLHPLHVESVAWVTERKDLLSGFFWILGLWFYAEYAEKMKRQRPGARRDYALTLGCFGLGLLSKPMMVTFPCVLLLLDFWPLMRFENFKHKISTGPPDSIEPLEPPSSGSFSWRQAKGLLVEKVPFFALAVAVSLITMWAQKKEGVMGTTDQLPMTWRLGNAVVAYATYLKKTFWPANLSPLYPHPGQWPSDLVALSAVLLLLITLLAMLLLRRSAVVAVGWFWFLGTLVPAIGIVQVGIQSMADRYTYIPLIGVFWALAWGLWQLAQRRVLAQRALCALAVGAVVGCSAVTLHQLQFWKNSEALFRRVLQVVKGHPQYNQALQTKPVYADIYINLGTALAMQRKYDEALVFLEKARKLNPKFADIYANIGSLYLMQGKWREALEELGQAAVLNPKDARIQGGLAQCFHELGRLDKAIEHYQAALKLNPSMLEARFNLGMALEEAGNISGAIHHYEAALQLNPGFLPARQRLNNLSVSRQK